MVNPDETQPLLGHVEQYQCSIKNQSLVDFDPNGDPDNPLDWPKAYKMGVVSLLAFVAFTV
jgi:hypothetical protein